MAFVLWYCFAVCSTFRHFPWFLLAPVSHETHDTSRWNRASFPTLVVVRMLEFRRLQLFVPGHGFFLTCLVSACPSPLFSPSLVSCVPMFPEVQHAVWFKFTLMFCSFPSSFFLSIVLHKFYQFVDVSVKKKKSNHMAVIKCVLNVTLIFFVYWSTWRDCFNECQYSLSSVVFELPFIRISLTRPLWDCKIWQNYPDGQINEWCKTNTVV